MGDNIFFNNNIMGSGILTRQMLEENDVDPIGWPESMRPKPQAQMEREPYHVIIDAYQDGQSACWIKITDDEGKWVAILEYSQQHGCWKRMYKRAGNIPRRIATVRTHNRKDDPDGIANVKVILRAGKLEWGMDRYDDFGDDERHHYTCVKPGIHHKYDNPIWLIQFDSSSKSCDGEREDGYFSISWGGPGPGWTSPEIPC